MNAFKRLLAAGFVVALSAGNAHAQDIYVTGMTFQPGGKPFDPGPISSAVDHAVEPFSVDEAAIDQVNQQLIQAVNALNQPTITPFCSTQIQAVSYATAVPVSAYDASGAFVGGRHLCKPPTAEETVAVVHNSCFGGFAKPIGLTVVSNGANLDCAVQYSCCYGFSPGPDDYPMFDAFYYPKLPAPVVRSGFIQKR